MGALALEEMTWPEIQREVESGRDTIVLCFGAIEQHGHHLPLSTDSVFGDELGRALAERLNAFHAPTVRVGCSQHHLAFPGTMSIEEETFHRVVADIVRGWARHGFKRVVLMPTHGGNFGPLAAAVEQLGEVPDMKVIAISDLSLLVQATLGLGAELGITAGEGGIHAGEWETSMMLSLRPELVRMERARPGYTGDLEPVFESLFAQGVEALSETGVIGDPRRASAERGRMYVERLVDLAAEMVERESR